MPLTVRHVRESALSIAVLVSLSVCAAQAQQSQGNAVEVDESALRYFAREGDIDRLNAEIARLKALYPQWVPPADPLSIPGGTDAREEALWQLYSQGDFAQIRAQIAENQRQEPSWAPSEALLDALVASEIRARLINASDLGQFETVLRVANDHPELMTCADYDVLWRVAEAYAETDLDERSAEAYRYVLENCDGPAERFATMQKAMTDLKRPAMVELLRLERSAPSGEGEFEGIRDELARRSVAESNADTTLFASPEDLSRVAGLFDNGQQVNDALMLGWYHLQRENVPDASEWFERASRVEQTAVGAQGLALVQIARGEFTQAEATLAPWRDTSEAARSVYLAAAANLLSGDPAPQVDETVLQRIVPEVVTARDAATARQLGWYARNFKQHETARQWFETALAWDPANEPSAYGLALSYVDLGKKDEAKAIKTEWDSRSQRIAAISIPTRRAGSSGDSVPRITDCSSPVSPSRLSPGTALGRGWCLLDAGRPIDATQAFARALQSSSQKIRSDAAYGQSLAYIRAGFVDQAAVAATQARQTPERSNEIMASILSERATAAYNRGRYREALQILDRRAQIAAEQVGLMVIRGYAYYNLKQYWRAAEVFDAAAKAGSTEAAEGLKLAQTARRKRW
ncbi:MAG: cellulose synthase [Pseudomonadota bacterium]